MCEKQAAACSLTASVVNYLYFAVTAGVVNGDGYCRKIVDRVFLSTHADRHVVDISFTVCFLCVCVCPQDIL